MITLLKDINFNYDDKTGLLTCKTCGKVHDTFGSHLVIHAKTHKMVARAKESYMQQRSTSMMIDNRREKYRKIGRLIWEKRHGLKENMHQFSERFGVHHSTVSNWETGKFKAPQNVIDFALTKEQQEEVNKIEINKVEVVKKRGPYKIKNVSTVSYPKLPAFRRFPWEKYFYKFTLRVRKDLIDGENMWKSEPKTKQIVTPKEMFGFIKSIVRIEDEDAYEEIKAIEIKNPKTRLDTAYNEGIQRAIVIIKRRLKSQTEET